jgi:hypothetical protein
LLCNGKFFTITGMVPHTPVWKLVLAVVVMAISAAIAIPLGRYAERDDAPGGVLIAALIFIGATLLAAWIVYPRPESGTRK